MLVATRRIVSVLGVLGSLCMLGATSAAASVPSEGAIEAEPLTTGNDCAKGCIDCQKDCHESRCMAACTMQWSGCCMSAGMKPPTTGSCACTSGGGN